MNIKSFKRNLFNISGCCMVWMILCVQNLKAQDESILFDIGSFSVGLLSEGQRQGGTGNLIGATDEMVKQAIPNGTYPSATNVFLVETGTSTILFDAGLGQKTVDNLALYGKKPSDIDAIFMTHFHGDHTGSLLIDGQKVYPKAKLYISKPEYDYYMSDAAMSALPENRRSAFTGARTIFNAYKGQLETFSPGEINNGTELIPGVKGVAAYGHTPGHVGYLLESEGIKMFMWGDLTHAMAIQMPFPQVAVSYDTDPVKAVEIRQKLLKYLAENNISIAGAHIEYPGMGDIVKSVPDGYIFVLMCSCSGRTPD
ncbi:MAG: MBL fold metallo-hydrolase [Tannerella sp.]|jgi:glyoxylase-like metal-dependent hydrolase (beta-lactamase superfamily II)|nr:MBL fold metallo-hydrolase [Tannerella sp.]